LLTGRQLLKKIVELVRPGHGNLDPLAVPDAGKTGLICYRRAHGFCKQKEGESAWTAGSASGAFNRP
jgi:hypothetical protein